MSLDFLTESDVRKYMETAIEYGIFIHDCSREIWVLTKGFQKWILRESLKPNHIDAENPALMIDLVMGYMESIQSGLKNSWQDVITYLGGEDKLREFLYSIQWMCDKNGLSFMTKLVILDMRNSADELGEEVALLEAYETLDGMDSEHEC